MKKLIKRISAVLLSILVLLSSMSVPTISTVMADEDTSEPVTEYVDESAEPEAPIEETLPVDPGYADTQDSFDAPAETEEFHEDVTEAEIETETAEEASEEPAKDENTELNKEIFPFSGSAGGVEVRVSADPGTFPVGTTMTVIPVSSEEIFEVVNNAVAGDVSEIKAVDITFYGPNGAEVQPNIPVHVYLQTPGMEQGADKEAFHIGEGGVDVIEEASIIGAQSTFDAQKFSVYGVAAKAAPQAVADTEEETTEPNRDGDGEGEETKWTVSFDPNTEAGGELSPIVIEVADGKTIGSALPSIEEVPGYNTKWVIKNTTTEVTAETIVTSDLEVVVSLEKIIYTVTFVQEDGTSSTRQTDIDDGFAVEDLPAVNPKTNCIGKWVYPGTTNEFTVGTVVSEDMTVEPYYEQNIFTVIFMSDGSQYEEMTTSSGTNIVLPSDPIKTGADFAGWFTEPDGKGNQYTSESTVDQDLTLYAYFIDQIRVTFLVKNEQGTVISEKSQYFPDPEADNRITTLPDEPFVEGKVFDHWENEETHEVVDIGTPVENSFNAIAVFTEINTYELTIYHYYMNGDEQVEVQTQVYDLTESDFSSDGTYTVTSPAFTIASEIEGDPTYYPSRPTITVNKSDFVKNLGSGKYEYHETDEFKAADASYKVGHYLKDLEGDGYTLIENVDLIGVKDSQVTPDVNSYAYAVYTNRDENVTLTGESGQELKVYYDRREFTLSFNVGAGDYVDAISAPYETVVSLPQTATRTGYTFAGWATSQDPSASTITSYELKDNTTLYAKWTPGQSEYKIVYMIENADDDGYSYLATVTKTAPTGSTITMTAQSAGASGTRPSDLDTTNFTFKESTMETVSADGTTVVIVKYSRNVYTITWNGSGYELDNSGRARWRTGRGNATLTAKYGANISAQWNATFNTPHPNWCWNFSSTNNDDKFTSLDIMPSGNRTVYHWYYSTTKTQVLNYWMENFESDTTTSYNGHNYGLFKTVTVHYNYLYDSDYPNYAGYTKGGWVRSDGARRLTDSTPNGTLTADFYYNALQYPLTFYNYDGALISTQQVTLGNDISSYLSNNVPEAPMPGATWLGWFTDSEHENPYTVAEGTTPKMPAGLVLYGNFEFPTHTVTFDSQGGTNVASQTDEYGFYAVKPDDPEREHYTFQGWFTAADETGSPYDWNRPVTEDITLYAHWTQETISYTVHYYAHGTTDKVLPDKAVSDPNFRENQAITEIAPTIAGHLADNSSVTLNLSFDEENNVITFYYSAIPNEITYTVNYVLKEHPEIKVAESKTVTVLGTTTNVLEMAKEVDADYLATQTSDAEILNQDYRPVASTMELMLAQENNVINFEYITYTTSQITVNHLDMDGNAIAEADSTFVTKGDTYTVQNKAPSGYVYHHAYLDGTTTAPQATYQITGEEGHIVINVYYQKKLIIIANNKVKTYDGTPLFSSFVSSDYTVTGNLRGDTITNVTFTGSQSDAGMSTTTPSNAQISKGAAALTDPETYYEIIYVPGTLTVKPVSVYISISADQWNAHSGSTGGPNYYTGQVFNVGFTNPGKQHFNEDTSKSAYVNISSPQRTLFKEKYGDAIWAALYGEDGALIKEKDVGYYEYSGEQQKALISGVTVDGQSMMSDPNYSITLNARNSFLQIVPLPITIKDGGGSKTYDGTALTHSDGASIDYHYWTANIGGEWTADSQGPGTVTLGTGDTLAFSVVGSQTEVGSSWNVVDLVWAAEGNNYTAKSSNYEVIYDLGMLEVTQGSLDIVIKDKTSTFNGAEQYGYGKTGDGTITVTGTGAVISTDDYTITGLAQGQVLTITGYTPASGTSVNTYTNGSFEGAAITVMNSSEEGAANVTENYEISTTAGKLTIDPKAVTITADDASRVYNSKPLTENGFSASALEEGDNHTFTVAMTNDSTITNVGTQANVIATVDGVTIEKSTDPAFAGTPVGNYLVKIVDGTLTINPKAVTITANDANKAYDGIALTQPLFTADALEEGDEHAFTVAMTEDSTITNVGTQPNVIATVDGVAVTSGTPTTVGNYTVTTANGLLTITEDETPLVITSATTSWTYDAQLHKDESYTVTYGGTSVTADETGKVFVLSTGDVITIEATAAGVTNVDDYASNNNTYSYTITKDGVDSSANFKDVVSNKGTISINPKAVTITANGNKKTYDGSALTEGGFSATDLEETDAHPFTVTMTEDSTITNVGTQPNVIATVDGVAVTTGVPTVVGNYTVTTVNGTLEIEGKKVTITAKDAEQTYNGSSLTQPEFTATTLETGDNHTFTVVMTGDSTITNVGTHQNVIATVDGVAVNAGTETAVGNYLVTTVNGTLTVNPKKVTITAKGATQTYNGSALTQPEFSATALEEDDEHEFTVVMTESSTITNVGTQPNVIATVDGKAVTTGTETAVGNYLVTTVNGTLEVTPKEVTITAKDASKTYDGQALTESGFTASKLEEGDEHLFTVVMSENSTITDVGTKDNVIATVDGVAVTTEGQNEVGNYLVTIVSGQLKINPKEVTITAKDASKTYDGKALTQPEFTATALATDDTHIFTVVMTDDSTITNVGTQPNVISTVDGTAVTTGTQIAIGNYLVTTVDGSLTVNPKTVTITAKDASKTYDGSALTQPEFSTSDLASGDMHTFTVVMTADSTITNVGFKPNVIATVDGVVVSTETETAVGNYLVTTINGSLKVNPKKVTITAEDASKTYNGSALTQPEFKASALETGDTHTFTVLMTESSTITNVGTQSNVVATVDGVVVSTGIETEVGNYLVTTADGTLTINRKAVTITANSANKPYDGSPLTESGFETSALETGDTHTFTVVMTDDSTITNVGTKDNVIATVDETAVMTETETEVGNYLVKIVNGKLEITADNNAIIITSSTKSWTYDGQTHVDEEYTVKYGETTISADPDSSGKVFTLSNGDKITITATAVGVKDYADNNVENNTFTYTILNGTTDTSGNYTSVSANFGTLSINRKAVTITAKDAQKTYDGKALTQSGFETSALETGDTHEFNVEMTSDSTITNVGTKDNVIATVDGTAVTTGQATAVGNYMVTTVDGTLTIDPMKVTITAKDAEQIYNSKALTEEGFTTSDLAEGDTHSFSVEMTLSSTITNVGTQPNVIAKVDGVTINTGVEKQIGNYLVTTVDGTLKVTPKKVTITAKDANKTYDGSALTQPGFEASALETGDKHTFTVVMTEGSTITDIGTQNNVIATVDDVAVTTGIETAVGNYLVTTIDGSLIVNPKTVTITAKDASKTYDGSALTQPEFEAGALETGDTHTFTVSMTDDSTITNIGTRANVISTVDGAAVIKSDDPDFAGTAVGNYLIKIVDGKLTVNPKKVSIAAKDAEKTYDGSALTQSEFTASALETGDTHTFTVVMTEDSTITNIGTQANVIATVDGTEVRTGTETAVGNYLITTDDGTLRVNPKKVTITAKYAEKIYNSSALTQPEFEASDLENGDTHTFTVVMTEDSTITNVGTQANIIATVDGTEVRTGAETAVGNYLITTVDGTLKVNPKIVSITAKSNSKTYDAKPLTEKGFEATALETGDTHIFTVVMTADSTITDVGNTDNVIATVDGTAVTTGEEKAIGNYLVTTHDGSLTINPDDNAIVIESSTKAWIYDGQTHTDEVYTVKYGETTISADSSGKVFALENGDVITITATASGVKDYTDNAEKNNTYTYTIMNGNTDTKGNYSQITANFGTLSINRKEVTITAKDAEKTYNGSALTQAEFTASALENGDTHTFTVVMTADSTITNVGTQPNVIATVDGAAVTTGTQIAIGNYLVTTYDGNLKVNPKKVTITAKDAEQIYNGSALTQPEFKASDLEEGDEHEFTVVMTSDSKITNVGIQPNVIAKVDGTAVTIGTETKVGNYLLTTVDGTLKVNPKEVTITASDAEQVYNSKALTEAGFSATDLEDGDSHKFKVVMTDDSTITNVGTQPNVIATVDGIVVTTETPTAVGNYVVTTVNGTLKVKPKAVTLTAKDASKVYDSKALTQPEFKSTALENGDSHTFSVVMTDDSTITNVGTHDNVIGTVDGVAVRSGVENEVGNYIVTIEKGTLEITPLKVKVTIVGLTDTSVYDGQKHTVLNYKATADSDLYDVYNDIEFSGAAEASRVDVGTTEMGLTDEQFENINNNFIVTFIVTDGYQTITPKAVTVTADPVEKEEEADEPELTVTIEGLVGDDTIDYEISREEGEEPGIYKITVTGKEEQGNYTVTFVDGEFTIVPLPVYTIIFDFAGGTINGDKGPVTMKVKRDKTITIIEAPVRDGYEFDYWEGSKHYPGDSYTVTGDHTFTAVWKEVKPADQGGSEIKTGDTNNIVPLIIAMSTAGLVIILLLIIFIRRRKQEDESEA